MTKTPAPGSDIFALATARQPFEYEVVHPGTGKGMGFFVTLISINEPGPKKVTRRVEDDRLKLANKRQNFTSAQMRQNSIDIIAACIESWRWGDDADGNPGSAGGEQLEFTPANIKRVLAVDEIRDQLDTEIANNANFFPS